MDLEIVQKLALAIGLGLLVGAQREWSASHIAGIRTFPLITLLGTFLALLDQAMGTWLVVAGVAAVTTVVIVGNVVRFLRRDDLPGITTEIAALLMYAVGVAIATDQTALGLIVGGSVAVLLQWKEPLHGFVERIGADDMRAIAQLILIALVILPVLPNQDYGPYGVLNPFKIWLMVVLIVGISVGSFMAYRFLGPKAGSLLGGVLGGLISSTATTVSYSRRTRHAPETANLATLVVMIASTIVFVRVLFEIVVVAPEILVDVVPPLAVMTMFMAGVCVVLYLRREGDAEQIPIDENPSELKPAIIFGLLYAAVLFAVAAVRANFGNQALYFVAALSGLTDMDAITLSTAQLIKKQQLDVDTGWRMILIGALSNLVFKCGAVALLGHRRMLLRVATVFGITLVFGLLLLAFWP